MKQDKKSKYNSRAELLLKGLHNKIEDAPGGDRAVLDREELLTMIDKISEVVLRELDEYRSVNDKKAAIIRDAESEAKEIVYKAEKEASRIRVTKRRDDEVYPYREEELSREERKSLRNASDIYAASLIYTDEMLTELSHFIESSFDSVSQEFERMQNSVEDKLRSISENRAELMGNLTEMKKEDRYSQILELSDLLSEELYHERQKAMAHDDGQLSLPFDDDTKKDEAEPEETMVEETVDKGLNIKVMDRSDEAVGRQGK